MNANDLDRPALARTYLAAPARASAAFLGAPKWLPNTQLNRQRVFFKTQDRVRYQANGSVIFLKTSDTHVHLRGQRVDSREIETHAMAMTNIESACVLPQQDVGESAGLLALRNITTDHSDRSEITELAPSDLSVKTLQELVKHLSDNIPEDRIPGSWFILENMRKLPSGEPDRLRLQEWLNARLTSPILSTRPSDASLQTSALTSDETEEQDPESVLKSYLNEKALDDFLGQILMHHVSADPNHIEQVSILSPSQKDRLVNSSEASYDFQLEVKDAEVQLSWRALANAWMAIVARHQSLRTVIIKTTSHQEPHIQVVLRSVRPRVVLTNLPSESIEDFDSSNSPVSFADTELPHRFNILKTPSGGLLVRLQISTAVFDRSSLSLLLDDLRKACHGHLENMEEPTEMPLSSSASVATESSKYMKQRLAGLEDFNWPSQLEARGERCFQTSRARFAQADFEDFCTRNSVEGSSVLQAAFALTLSHFAGQKDLAFALNTRHHSGFGEITDPLFSRCAINQEVSNVDFIHQVEVDYKSDALHMPPSPAFVEGLVEAKDALSRASLSILSDHSTAETPRTEFEVRLLSVPYSRQVCC